MTWFKVDDTLPTHRKVLSLPRGARRLGAIGAWTMGGAWSSANGTEGLIPAAVLADLGIPTKVAADLLASGLWKREPQGYRMHDFLDYNPTAEKVAQDRAAAAERQRKAREKAKAARDATSAAANGHGASHDGSHGVTGGVTPGVSHGPPDPTRPEGEGRGGSLRSLPTTPRSAHGGVDHRREVDVPRGAAS